MITGHFGLAAGVKAVEPRLPLWTVVAASQLLELAFVPLYLAGVETLEPSAGPPGYGNGVIHAWWSHSLLTAVVLAVVVGVLGARRWGRRAGAILGATVFSHWVLDLLVHRPDLAILPGNLGGLPLLGLGLWQAPVASAVVEGALAVTGAVLYARSVRARARTARGRGERRSLVAAAVMAAGLAGCLVTGVLGL